MKVTNIEVVRSRKPILLPEEWRAAWWEPDGAPVRSFGFSFYKVHTDEGIVGIGPYGGDPDPFVMSALIGSDPFLVGRFADTCMNGRELTSNRGTYGGLEVALWDIIGKALSKPVYRLLGAQMDRVMAYAATTRLLKPEEHVKQVLDLVEMGFRAVKLRLHRPRHEDDLEVVREVREAIGPEVLILADANQNNRSLNYRYWSRGTAAWMAKELERLEVYLLEEPLPRRDVEGLAELADSVEMLIAGGEHCPNAYEFREYVVRAAYDVVQPDVILGDIGITGIRKIAGLSDYFGRMVVPHVCSAGNLPLSLAATLQAVATLVNCPMVEYPLDPPILTVENQQRILKEPILVDRDGFLKVPEKPGIGVELDRDTVAAYL